MKLNLWKISSLFCAALFGLLFLFSTQAKTGGYVETDLVVNKEVDTVPTLMDSHGVTHVAKFFDALRIFSLGILRSRQRDCADYSTHFLLRVTVHRLQSKLAHLCIIERIAELDGNLRTDVSGG